MSVWQLRLVRQLAPSRHRDSGMIVRLAVQLGVIPGKVGRKARRGFSAFTQCRGSKQVPCEEAESRRSASPTLGLRRRSGSLPSVAPILCAGADSLAQLAKLWQPAMLGLTKEPGSLSGRALAHHRCDWW